MIEFIHALFITPFEKDYLGSNRANWGYVAEQDFPVRALYCKTSKEIIFYGDDLNEDTSRDIDLFLINLNKCGIKCSVLKQIICLDKGEDEYSKETVMRHFQ